MMGSQKGNLSSEKQSQQRESETFYLHFCEPLSLSISMTYTLRVLRGRTKCGIGENHSDFMFTSGIL